MAERLTRKALYDLVWSEPMMTLSARFQISDVALKKTCARAGIPTPERGYWPKKDAEKEVFQAAFPSRPPGMNDEIEIGAGGNTSYGYRAEEDLLVPIGPPPEFPEPIEAVRARIAETIGQVKVPKKVLVWHPIVDRLLKEDEKRREKQLSESYTLSWEKPRFDSPLDRRRLRILNSLFLAAAKMNGKASIHGRETLGIGISFFQQHLPISLERPKKPNRRAQVVDKAEDSGDMRLCLSLLRGGALKRRWQLGKTTTLTSWKRK